MEQTLNLTLLHRSANRAMRGKIDAAARFPPCGDNAGKLKSASYSLVRPYPRCSLAKWSSMAGQSPRVLFFAGTDTNVGKTHLAALATRELVQLGYRVGVYKPVASGCTGADGELVATDAMQLWEASGRRHELHQVCPQRFRAELAPHLAARLEGTEVDEALMIEGLNAVSQDVDIVIAEGAGGLMSPLSDHLLNSSLAKRWDAQIILVVANRLGAIHQALATVMAAGTMRLPLIGMILNQVSAQADAAVTDNAAVIARFTDVPILSECGYRPSGTGVDWNQLPAPREAGTRLIQAWL